MKNLILSVFLIFFLGIKVYAQKSEIINSENGTLNIKNLKEGTKDYLVYMSDNTKQKRTAGDLWRRTTTFKKLNGKDVVEFTWKSFLNGKPFNETVNIVDK